MRYPASEKLEIIRLVEQSACAGRRRSWVCRGLHFIAGMTSIRPVGRKRWAIGRPNLTGSGTGDTIKPAMETR